MNRGSRWAAPRWPLPVRGIPDGPFPLALTGGLFRHEGTHLAEALIETVHAERPEAKPVRAELPPVAGALLLAFDDAGPGHRRDGGAAVVDAADRRAV